LTADPRLRVLRVDGPSQRPIGVLFHYACQPAVLPTPLGLIHGTRSREATPLLEEIEALDAFYRSPVGSSVMQKMPQFMQASMGQLGPDMMQMQQRIQQRVMEAMSK